jgi:hypothetical protein
MYKRTLAVPGIYRERLCLFPRTPGFDPVAQFLYREHGFYNVARGTRGTCGAQDVLQRQRDGNISSLSVNILYHVHKNNNKKNTIMHHTYAPVVHDLHVDKIKGDSEDSDKATCYSLHP